MRIAVCKVGFQMQEIQIDGLKSQLNDKQKKNTLGNFFWWQCVDKGAFLLLREGVTSSMSSHYMVKFYS